MKTRVSVWSNLLSIAMYLTRVQKKFDIQIGNKGKIALAVCNVHGVRYFEVPLRIVGHVKREKRFCRITF
jgi:hypothetical protein